MKIPLMKNTFLHETATKKKLAEFILNSPRLSMDKTCYAFEEAFKMKQGRAEAVLVNSGGSANLAVLQALKNLGRLKDGDRVAYSALTWSTNVMPIIQLGLIPVPVDIEPRTLNVMSDTLKKVIAKDDIRAFFTTNVLGFAGDLHKIRELCHENNVIFLEDNCESLESSLPEGKTGNFSLASTFSFYVAHHMSTIEGGMICTDDEELGMMLKIVRANGWDRNLSLEQQKLLRDKYTINNSFDASYTFYDLGFNLRPTEITGFLGLEQLKYLDEAVSKRVDNLNWFLKTIKGNSDFIELNTLNMDIISSFAFPIICKKPKLREKYISMFENNGVEIRPIIAGNILKQPFYARYADNSYELSGTDFIDKSGFYIGNYPELSADDLELIENCLKEI